MKKQFLFSLALALATSAFLAAPVQAKGRHPQPGDNRGGNHVEPGDDRGVHAEPGDDRGAAAKPGDDKGNHVEPGDDHGKHGPGHHLFPGFDFSGFFKGLL